MFILILLSFDLFQRSPSSFFCQSSSVCYFTFSTFLFSVILCFNLCYFFSQNWLIAIDYLLLHYLTLLDSHFIYRTQPVRTVGNSLVALQTLTYGGMVACVFCNLGAMISYLAEFWLQESQSNPNNLVLRHVPPEFPGPQEKKI